MAQKQGMIRLAVSAVWALTAGAFTSSRINLGQEVAKEGGKTSYIKHKSSSSWRSGKRYRSQKSRSNRRKAKA